MAKENIDSLNCSSGLNLDLISHVSITLDKNSRIHNDFGNPARRKGPLGCEVSGRRHI
jgi:hypothetical protein